MTSNRKKTLADYPQLTAELDRAHHPMLDPARIPHRSWVVLHWVCAKNATHCWSAPPANRTRQPKCPFCTGKKTDPKQSLATLYPELAQQWHPSKNGRLRPCDVLPHSSRSVWWQDPHHPSRVWRAVVSSRIVGSLTPWERGLRADRYNCLSTTHPAVAKLFIAPAKGRRFSPRTITAGSNFRARWRCPRDPEHVWEAAVYTVVNARHAGCPRCAHRVSWEQSKLFAGLARRLPGLEYETGASGEIPLGVVGWRCGFDARLGSAHLLIDYDGHRFHSSPASQARDRRKVKAARNAGWRVIRIRAAPLKIITRDDIRVPHHFDRETCVTLVLEALKTWHRKKRGFPLFHLC